MSSNGSNLAKRKRKKAKKSRKSSESEGGEVVLKFRNYAPPDAIVPEDAAPETSEARKVEAAITKKLHESMVTRSDEAVSITAKSPDWDLKRDIEGKLKKLNRMTLRSIRDLVQQRIETEKQNESSIFALRSQKPNRPQSKTHRKIYISASPLSKTRRKIYNSAS